MKLLRIMLICAAALLCAGGIRADVTEGWRVAEAVHSSNSGTFSLSVKKIDFRKDLTRVYCTIVGRPNTSARITAITMGNRAATDIDGIDMGRYFQFEEEGLIDLEIDFPPLKPASKLEIKFTTPVNTLIFTLRR